MKRNNEIVEKYSVTTGRDEITGVVVSEEWRNSEGKLHRIGAPADIGREPSTGTVFYEKWYMNGEFSASLHD